MLDFKKFVLDRLELGDNGDELLNIIADIAEGAYNAGKLDALSATTLKPTDYICLRCDWHWKSRPKGRTIPPLLCPKCHSPGWSKPRRQRK